MTVGYRYWAGIGTKQSCKDALGWYKSAADAALRSFNAGPPAPAAQDPPLGPRRGSLRSRGLLGAAFIDDGGFECPDAARVGRLD
mgnify:CR=1 FL=1